MTSREFAELIGVSQTTVSRALNGSPSVSEKTRIYIEQKAKEYGFVLNFQARTLKTSKTQTIGMLNALSELGVDVPGQAQIFGMDDIPLASWFRPKLSTMRSPVRQMVKEGCDLLINLIEGKAIAPQTVYYQAQMVLRDTTR